jgi:hypothetical protein
VLLLELSETIAPPEGAAPLRVMVTVVGPPPVAGFGLMLKPVMVGSVAL